MAIAIDVHLPSILSVYVWVYILFHSLISFILKFYISFQPQFINWRMVTKRNGPTGSGAKWWDAFSFPIAVGWGPTLPSAVCCLLSLLFALMYLRIQFNSPRYANKWTTRMMNFDINRKKNHSLIGYFSLLLYRNQRTWWNLCIICSSLVLRI